MTQSERDELLIRLDERTKVLPQLAKRINALERWKWILTFAIGGSLATKISPSAILALLVNNG